MPASWAGPTPHATSSTSWKRSLACKGSLRGPLTEEKFHDGVVSEFSKNSFGWDRRNRHERHCRSATYARVLRLRVGHEAFHVDGAVAESRRDYLRWP